MKWGGELLHLRWIFPLVLESIYEGAVGSTIGVDSGLYDLVLSYRFLLKDRWIFSGWCGGYPTWDTHMICGASAICLDPPSVRIFWKDPEDPGGCLSLAYTSNKQFRESRLLAIIGSPWPMTLANEAYDTRPHEWSYQSWNRRKKTLTIKVKKWLTCWDVT